MAIPNAWLDFAPKPRPLDDEDRWHVFLSYRTVNRPWVLNLYDVLHELDYRVFLDQYALQPGDQLRRKLEQALDQSQNGVLIWSAEAAHSEWVRQEYDAFSDMVESKPGFRFVPVRLDHSKLPAFARQRLFVDFRDYPDGPNGGELLRLLHALAGLTLSKEATDFALEQDEAAKKAAAKIDAAIDMGNSQRLIELFQEGALPWKTSAALGCKAAEGLVELGSNDRAIEMLEELEAQFPKAIRPKQLRALAIARRGGPKDLEIAQELVGEMYQQNERDPETVGILARTWKDRYKASGNKKHLRKSRDLYAEACNSAQDDYYTGINAASLSVVLGSGKDLDLAKKYRDLVVNVVGTKPTPDNYWKTATAAEAALLGKDYDTAADLYDAAVAMAPEEIGSHKSTRKQARLLLECLGASDDEIAKIRKPFDDLED